MTASPTTEAALVTIGALQAGTKENVIPDEAVIKELTLPKWPAEINRQSVETLATLAVQDGLVTKQPDLAALLP